MHAERVSLILAESGTTLGGTERVVWELATRLPTERYALRVWLSTVSGVDEMAEALTAGGVTVERVAEVDSRWDWRGMWDTVRALRRARPTILHVHHVWPAADRYLSELALWAGVPHQVVTEHLAGRSHSRSQRSLKRRELRRAGAVTTVCRAIADTLAEDLRVASDRFTVIPNGVDEPLAHDETEAARTWRLNLGAGVLTSLVACVGRLEEQKGQDVLLEAAAILRGRGLDFVLAFAGRGEQAEPLVARARALGIAERVRWLGHLEDPGPLLRAADVCVLPSRWEGLPLVLLEAMVRGAAVVASSVGGVPEVLVDSVNGLLVPPGDAAALAVAIERLLRSPSERAALGTEAEDLMRRDYGWDHVVAEFEQVYDEVLGLSTFAADMAPRRAGRARRGLTGTRT